MSQPKLSDKQALAVSITFLLIVGTLVALITVNKWEAALFVLVTSFGIVVFGVLPPKESEEKSDIVYFNLSAEAGQSRTTTYKKYFIGMTIALVVICIPSVVKYYFL